VTGSGAPANRRAARAALCALAALTGLAVVLVVAGREPLRHQPPAVSAEAPAVTALPASLVGESALRPATGTDARPAWQPPVAARARRDDGGAPARPERFDSPSFAGGDWRESVADALGRTTLEGMPANPGAMHSHVQAADAALPEPRGPDLVTGAAPPGTQGLDGWDGGKFWFGPKGLVRMKEAQP
jgi:hypothetical protein